MAKRSVYNKKTILDPMFPIPEELQGLEYDDFYTDSGEFENESESGDTSSVDDDPALSGVPTPIILGIHSQTIKTTKSGSQVVDVLLDVEGISQDAKYEVRIVKR